MIVLDEASALDPVRIFGLLKDLLPRATLRVILLRPRDNTIDVYEKRRVIATRRADLLALVRGFGNEIVS